MRTYDFGTGKWVFIDWMGIDPGYGTAWSGADSVAGEDQPVGLTLKVHRPRVIPEWVIAPDRPWDREGVSPYASFLEHQGRFHCWYERYGSEADMGIEVNVAYAVSGDHIDADMTWRGGALAGPCGQTVRLHTRIYRADLYAIHSGNGS
jgi:hypothetical protein